MANRLERFHVWRDALVKDKTIMGGESVFPNSRLPVQTIGGRINRGEDRSVILEDYPYLTKDDLDFAHMFVKAYPRVGRPRKSDQVSGR